MIFTTRRCSVCVQTEPQGKARPRADGRSGRIYTPSKTAKYEKLIREEFKRQNPDWSPAEEAVSVTITAGFRIPLSWSKKKREAAVSAPVKKKPDIDNIEKAILDALNGVAYVDDALIARTYCMKVFAAGEPYIVATIEIFDEVLNE